MKQAIASAGISPTDIEYINAHATSTPVGDARETQAIKMVFGEHAYQIPVNATKSMTGHMLGAAGAVELISTALAIRDNIVPPTINYQTPDPDCDLNYTPNTAVKREINAAVSNTFGFGGHNACMSIIKFRE